MIKRIKDTSATLPLIRDTSPTLPPVDPAQVAAALGAEPMGVSIEAGGSPLGRIAAAREIGKRLQSSAASRKIPLSDEQWRHLEELAAAFGSDGFKPSAGQVASAILSLALRALTNESADHRQLAQELAAMASANPAPENGPAVSEEGSAQPEP